MVSVASWLVGRLVGGVKRRRVEFIACVDDSLSSPLTAFIHVTEEGDAVFDMPLLPTNLRYRNEVVRSRNMIDIFEETKIASTNQRGVK